MDQASTALQSILQPQDKLCVTLEAYVFASADSVYSTGVYDEVEWQARSKRFLSVVTHQNDLGGFEEGSVFIMRVTQDGSTNAELDLHRLLAIVHDFAVSTAQKRQGSWDSGLPLPAQPSEFILTISPGQSQGGNPIVLLIKDVEHLRSFLEHCNRLKNIINANADPTVETHSWVNQYKVKPIPAALLSPIPQDIRSAQLPILSRLSPASVDVPGDDIADIAVIRDHWVRQKARQAAGDASHETLIKIRLGTYNVNGKLPSQDLSLWVQGRTFDSEKEKDGHLTGDFVSETTLAESGTSFKDARSMSESFAHSERYLPLDSDEENPDIIVLGFQELDLSAEALIYSTSTEREDNWCMAIFAALGEKAVLYEKLVSKQLVGILLVVIVKKSIKSRFVDVQTSSIGVGLMGTMGNKGGTAIRLGYTPSPSSVPITFTFVDAHLAAFDELVEKRHSDFHDISKRLNFSGGYVDNAPVSIYEFCRSYIIHVLVPRACSPCSLSGDKDDLNYRIDLPDAEIRTILSSEHWDRKCDVLAEYDQLRNAVESRKAFHGFREHAIPFFPTYRFDASIATDALGYDKKRKPAWTDRILYYPGPLADVVVLSYCSHPGLAISDHKPVATDLLVCFPICDNALHEAAIRSHFREIDDLELVNGVELQLSNTSIDIGKISYKQLSSHELTVKNTGKVPCAYRFIAAETGNPIHPGWLQLSCLADVLLPGESTTLTLSVYVDDPSAAILNVGPRRIGAFLVLHAMLGKNYFVTISGEYEHTCFANSLAHLVRLPGPIRTDEALLPEENAVNAPREVIRLVNWLMTHAASIDDLFISPAEQKLVATIRECLDTGADFPFTATSSDRHVALAFGETLLQLLASLTEHIIPLALQSRCTEVTDRDTAFQLLEEFPQVSSNVRPMFSGVDAYEHLQMQDKKHDANDRAQRLATVFARVLFRQSSITPVAKRDFLLHFIA